MRGGKNYYYNERVGGSGMGKVIMSYFYIELREFESQSFHEFLTWNEEEEDNRFYAQSTGKKTVQVVKLEIHFHALGMYELMSSAVLYDTELVDTLNHPLHRCVPYSEVK